MDEGWEHKAQSYVLRRCAVLVIVADCLLCTLTIKGPSLSWTDHVPCRIHRPCDLQMLASKIPGPLHSEHTYAANSIGPVMLSNRRFSGAVPQSTGEADLCE